jgi:hypothetical protein
VKPFRNKAPVKDVLLLELKQLSESPLEVLSHLDRQRGIVDLSWPSDRFKCIGEVADEEVNSQTPDWQLLVLLTH